MNPRPDDPFEEPDRRPSPEDGAPRASRGGSRAAAGAGRPPPDAPDADTSDADTSDAGASDADARDAGASDADAPERETPMVGTVREPTPITQQLGRIVIVLLAVLFGVFAVDNSQAVDFSWVFGESQVAPDGTGGVPLIVLLVAAALVGAALGALIEWQFIRGRRARRAEQERARRAEQERARRAEEERD